MSAKIIQIPFFKLKYRVDEWCIPHIYLTIGGVCETAADVARRRTYTTMKNQTRQTQSWNLLQHSPTDCCHELVDVILCLTTLACCTPMDIAVLCSVNRCIDYFLLHWLAQFVQSVLQPCTAHSLMFIRLTETSSLSINVLENCCVQFCHIC